LLENVHESSCTTHDVSSVFHAYRLSRAAAVLACALVVACGVDQAEEQFGTGTYEANVLASSIASSQTLAAKGLQLHLVSYTPAAALDATPR